MSTTVTTTDDRLRILRTASTLCLITQTTGTSLASWCPYWKRWINYSRGEFVKGEVTSFFPLQGASWQHKGAMSSRYTSMFVVQLYSGRFALASLEDGAWIPRKTNRKVRETVLRFVRVDKLREGSFRYV